MSITYIICKNYFKIRWTDNSFYWVKIQDKDSIAVLLFVLQRLTSKMIIKHPLKFYPSDFSFQNILKFQQRFTRLYYKSILEGVQIGKSESDFDMSNVFFQDIMLLYCKKRMGVWATAGQKNISKHQLPFIDNIT